MVKRTKVISNILFAADPSRPIEFALKNAVALADQLEAELHVLQVLAENAGIKSGRSMDAAVATAQQKLNSLLPAEGTLNTSNQTLVRIGQAADEIVAYARECSIDLIFLGSRGRRSLSQFFWGSVADQVHQLASCPILMVPLEQETQQREHVVRAAKVLQAKFGHTFEADDTTRQQLAKTLTADLHVDDQQAEDVIQQLEDVQAIVWSGEPQREEGSPSLTCCIDLPGRRNSSDTTSP